MLTKTTRTSVRFNENVLYMRWCQISIEGLIIQMRTINDQISLIQEKQINHKSIATN